MKNYLFLCCRAMGNRSRKWWRWGLHRMEFEPWTSAINKDIFYHTLTISNPSSSDLCFTLFKIQRKPLTVVNVDAVCDKFIYFQNTSFYRRVQLHVQPSKNSASQDHIEPYTVNAIWIKIIFSQTIFSPCL